MNDIKVPFDLDKVGRKELQALAKSFGIKANQKSDVLKEKLREAVALKRTEENDSDDDEGLHAEEEKEEGNATPSEEAVTNIGNIKTKYEASDSIIDNGNISMSNERDGRLLEEKT